MGPLFRSTRRWFSSRRNNVTRPTQNKNRSRLWLTSLEGREVPAALIVTDAGDFGANTLRGKIIEAMSNAQDDTITFSGVTSITLTGGQMDITGEAFGLVVDGGAGVTVNSTKAASATSRIFNVNIAGGDPVITFKNLTLSGGNLNAGNGGAVLVHNDSMLFENVTFKNNKTTAAGGALATTTTTAAFVTVKSSNFDNNSAGTTGGAINATSTISLTIDSTTFNKNSASTTGGAINIAVASSVVIIDASTFTSQSAGTTGGAINTASTVSVDIGDSTFTSNRGTTGGAMHFAGNSNVVIDKSTISGNTAATSTGGGINLATITGTSLTLTSSTVANNTAASNGGGIRMGSAAATISLSNITGNTSGAAGGAIYFTTGSVSASFSSFSSNSAVSTGGGIHLTSGTLTLDNSTVAKNITNSTSGGGGINFSNGNVTLRNSTLSSNTAANGAAVGGGARGTSSGTLNIHNSTVTNNTASGAGGGGIASTGTTSTTLTNISIISSIVAQNVNTAHPDLYSAATTTTLTTSPQYSLIGADSGSVSITADPTNIVGTVGTPANAMLAKLGNYGGPTQTHAPQSGSPVLDKGFNFLGASEDQRGTGFSRTIDEAGIGNANDGTDMGSYEGFLQIPTIGSVTVNNVTTAGGTSYQVVVVYNDATGIDTTTIDINDISISGFTPVSVSFTGPVTAVTATYTFTPPGGSFDKVDNGNYTVTINAGQVEDIDNNAIDTANIATFFVAIPQTFTVTLNTDEDDGNTTPGDISIREAIKLANLSANSTDTIVFDNSLAGSTITITSVLGSLNITDAVVITGLGASSITLDGTGQANTRAFNIDMTATGAAVSISGMTVQNFSVTGDGGAINNADAALTLTNVWLHKNTASVDGGAINLELAGSALTIVGSVVSNNTATTGDGGGIDIEQNSTLTIKTSVLRDNVALGTGGDGGAFFTGGAGVTTILIENSTISGNTANHTASTVFGGGGAYINGTGTLTVINSTISNNTAVAGGGGFHIDDASTVSVFNSTIAGNSAGSNGGGINLASGTVTLNLYSSIVAVNLSNAVGEDIFGAVSSTVNMEASNISDTAGMPTLNQTGFNLTNVDPLLDPLADNGGFTLPDGTKIQTRSISPSSQAKDKGANSLTLTTDQRGAGFNRQVGAGVDMGSLELVTVIPGAVATAANVPPANPTHVATVTFTDETGINTAGIANGNIRIIGVGYSPNTTPTSHTITFGNNGDQTVTVEYTFGAPGGSWDWFENGVYDIEMQGGQVFDTDGSPNAVPMAVIGSFSVNLNLPATLTVDKNADVNDGKYGPGELTLREAVALSNSSPTFETINFAGALNGQTISLDAALGALTVTDAVTITGPGAANLTVSAGSSSIRLFTFNVPGSNVMSNISGLTLRDGKITGSGGAILLADDGLTLSSVTLTNNSASSTGGAIQMTGGTLVVNNSTLSSNTSGSTGGAIQTSTTAANITIGSSTITGNSAVSSGGAVYLTTATISITNSTISANTGTSGGGVTASSGTINVTGSKILNNTASSTGGGLRLSSTGTLNVTTSTVSGNTGTTGGGIYTASGTSSITYSTIANNVSTSTTGGAGLNLSNGTMTIQNSTISQNTALSTGIGGAIRGSSSGTLTIDNTTITRNSAGGNGGGGLGFSGTSSTTLTNVNINSSIVAQNFNAAHPDLFSAATSTTLTANVNFSIVGADSGVVLISGGNNQMGTVGSPLDAQLAPLNNYGGPTQTHGLSINSPALDKGSNSSGAVNDQRGAPFVRIIDEAGIINASDGTDVGAFEGVNPFPLATGTAPTVTTAGAGTHTVTVVYSDNVGINTGTLGNNDIEVSGPGYASPVPGTFLGFTGSGQVITATYSIPAPGGTFDKFDAGTYTINMLAGGVSDGTNDVPAGAIGSFLVAIPGNFVVDSTADTDDGDYSAGKLTLREAVRLSNASVGSNDTISFALGINAQTITLTTASGGQLTLSDAVQIDGPGTALLTISGNSANRVFNISNGLAGAIAVSLSGVVLTGGKVTGDGGAINIADESVTITNVNITGNTATADGGGINLETDGGSLTLLSSNVSGNTAGTAGDADGGGINIEGAATTTIKNSTIANNTAFDDGGGILFQKRLASHTVFIEGTTFSNNAARGATGGGGGINFGGVFSGGLTIRNSTISGNSANDDGGGIQFYAVLDTAVIRNTTIANNTAKTDGGGINQFTDATGVINIESSIVSNNDAGALGDDVQSLNGSVDSKYNAFGSNSVTNFTDNGQSLFGQNLKLGALAFNGGPTQTIKPAADSPVIDKGSNPSGLTTDQRGGGNPRTIDDPAVVNATDGTDIGAYELDPAIPSASLSAPNVTTPGGTLYSFTVTYSDDVAIDVTTLGTGDVTVTGPNGFSVVATFKGVDNNTPGTPRVATYEFTPPGGSWDSIDNGAYTVTLNAAQVTDNASPTPNPVPAGALGTFNVALPIIAVVTTLVDENDGGPGGTGLSLREALGLSNASTSTLNSITFDPALFTGGDQTITLTLGQLLISNAVTITGPGMTKLTVSGNNASRVFNVASASAIAVELQDFTVANGKSTLTSESGGNIQVDNETLTLTRMTVRNGFSPDDGGGIGMQGSGGTLIIQDSVIRDNVADNTSSIGDGGGVHFEAVGNLTVRRSTISGNVSDDDGGGIHMYQGGSLLIEDSTVSGNTATAPLEGGGGMYIDDMTGATVTIRNSTFSGNKSGIGGGAILMSTFSGTLTIQNSTFFGNEATNGGAVRVASGTGVVNIASSIFHGNTAATGPAISSANAVNVTVSILQSSSGITAPNFDATTTASIGVDPLLDVLANYGGSTQTHSLKVGSPAIDQGVNASGSLTDQRGKNRTYDDPAVTNGAGSDATDIGAFERNPVGPPPTATVKIDSGTGQRSMIQSITVTFSEAVTLGANPFTVQRLNTSTIPAPAGVVTLAIAGSGSTYTITFNDPTFATTVGSAKSLIDGLYSVTLNAADITSVATGLQFDGDGNGTGGDNDVENFHRLFGDVRGASTIDLTANGFTDNVDLLAFRSANGSDSTMVNYDQALDYNGDGFIDNIDLLAFRGRIGTTP